MRITINNTDARALEAEERTNECMQMGRMQLESAQSSYKEKVGEVWGKVEDITQEVKKLQDLLSSKERDVSELVSQLTECQTKEEKQASEYKKLERETSTREAEYRLHLERMESSFVTDKQIAMEEHQQETLVSLEKFAAELRGERQAHDDEMERAQLEWGEKMNLKIQEMEKLHTISMHELKAKHSHEIHQEREHLGSALDEARSISEELVRKTNSVVEEKDIMSNEFKQLEKEKKEKMKEQTEKVQELMMESNRLQTCVEELESSLREKSHTFDSTEQEHRASLERYRTVALALEEASETLKGHLKQSEEKSIDLEQTLERERAKNLVAERLLEKKNVEIRRLTQGVRMKDSAVEQASQRAHGAEVKLQVLSERLSEQQRQNDEAKRNVYVDITLGNGSNGGNGGNDNFVSSNQSFGERLEQSLSVAGRQVEELADKQHDLWRRDVSFQAWRSENHTSHGGERGLEEEENLPENDRGRGSRTSKGMQSGDGLNDVERRLVTLQNRIHAKVNAVTSVATPMSVRGRRNYSEQDHEKTNEDENEMNRSFEF